LGKKKRRKKNDKMKREIIQGPNEKGDMTMAKRKRR
jgi:hypothetical protein